MKKLKDVYLLHYCLAWATRDELRAKAAAYANPAYDLWWEAEHEVLPVGALA